MNGDAPISWLMFFTLAAAVAVGAGAFLSFMRSRHNREIAVEAIAGDGQSKRGEPSGAGLELAGILAVAMVAMVLLSFGYNTHKGVTTAQAPAGTSNNLLATDRADPNTPKPYQPANPTPDPRAAQTGSTTGSGADNGGRPEQTPK